MNYLQEHNLPDNQVFLDPPDPSIAAGPTSLVLASNTEIQVVEKKTKQQLIAKVGQSGISLYDFYLPLNQDANLGLLKPSQGGLFTDTRVIYDPTMQRFVLTSLYLVNGDNSHQSDELLIAVSQSSDPTNSRAWSLKTPSSTAWTFTAIHSLLYMDAAGNLVDSSAGTVSMDYPVLSAGPSGVVITLRTYQVTGTQGIEWPVYYQLPWDALEQGSPNFISDPLSPNVYVHSVAVSGSSRDPVLRLVPTRTTNDSADPYLVGFEEAAQGSNDYIALLDSAQTLGSTSLSAITAPSATIDVGNITNGAYSNLASQPRTATQVDAGYGFMDYALQSGQTIWAVNTVTPPGGTVPVAQYYTLNLSPPALAGTGTIPTPVTDPGAGTFYPSIAMNAPGDLGFAYNASSSNSYVSGYVTSLLSGGSAFQPPERMLPGIGSLTAETGDQRYGDFTTTAIDPDGTTFWSHAESAMGIATVPGGITNKWSTSYISFSVQLPPPGGGIAERLQRAIVAGRHCHRGRGCEHLCPKRQTGPQNPADRHGKR